MTVFGKIQKGAYFDSVTLMNVGKAISAQRGWGESKAERLDGTAGAHVATGRQKFP